MTTQDVSTTDEARDERIAERRTRLVETDPQFRGATPDPDLAERVLASDLPLAQVIEEILSTYADRPALGRRATEVVTGDDGSASVRLRDAFETVSYRELGDRVRAVATAWHSDGLQAV